jgi:DNA-binding CsgD family transcriptional regulator
MLDILTENEKEVVLLIIQGHNFNGITQHCAIDYNSYKKIKKSIFAKLNVNNMNKLLGFLLQQGYSLENI